MKTNPFRANDLLKYVKAVTDRTSLSVQYDAEKGETYTSRGVMHLPPVHAGLTAQQTDHVMYSALRETLKYTEDTDFRFLDSKKLDYTHPLAKAFSVLEQGRVERQGASQYRGDAALLNRCYPVTTERFVKDLSKSLGEHEELAQDGEALSLAATKAIDNRARSDWMSGSTPFDDLFDDALKNTTVKDVVSNKSFDDRASTLNSTQEAYELAKDIVAASTSKTPEEVEQEMQEGDGGEGTGDEEGDSEGSGGGGELTDKGDDGAAEASKVEYKWFTEEQSNLDHNKRTTPLHIDYSNWSPSHNTFLPEQDYIVVNLVEGKSSGGGGSGDNLVNMSKRKSGYRRLPELEGTLGSSFANKIRRLLQIAKRSRIVHAQAKGRKLDRKNFKRVGFIKQQGMEDYAGKIFKSTEVQLDLDVAVTVLCDFSGSMCGDKTTKAVHSMMLINKAISTSLRVPLQLLTFSTSRNTMMGVVKTFNKTVSDEVLLDRLSVMANVQQCNADGDAIMWAYNALKNRPEKRKVLIVLSDGQPAGGCGDIAAYTLQVTKQIEKEGGVQLIGIGIMDSSVKRFYTNHEVIHKASDLEQVLLSTIKNYIFN